MEFHTTPEPARRPDDGRERLAYRAGRLAGSLFLLTVFCIGVGTVLTWIYQAFN